MHYLNTLLFGVYPYLALTVCVVASVIRYDREQYTWKTGSSQLLESRLLHKGSKWFHIGIIMILMGHFVGLLTPHFVWDILHVSASFKQKIAMSVGGIFGIMCFYGLTILLYRRFTNERVRATSSKMDIIILVLLYIQLILGLSTIFVSAGHLDGSEMLHLMHWAQSIAIFNSTEAVHAIENVHWLFKIHIFLGLTVLFLLFPFSRLVHIASVPVGYVKRNYQVVRSKKMAKK